MNRWLTNNEEFMKKAWTKGCVIHTENPNFIFGIWNQVALMYNKEAPKVNSLIFFRCPFSLLICATPFNTQKRFVPFIGLWKIFTESKDMSQNVYKLRSPSQTSIFLDILVDFSGPIFVFKPWAQARPFEYHEPYKKNNFFWVIEGFLDF